MQDENIRGWHKGLFGKQVQNSALGTLKSKLMSNPNVLIVDKFFPSTRMCPRCGAINEGITLSDRSGSQPSIPRMRYGSILRNALKRKEPGSSIFKRQLRWSSSPP